VLLKGAAPPPPLKPKAPPSGWRLVRVEEKLEREAPPLELLPEFTPVAPLSPPQRATEVELLCPPPEQPAPKGAAVPTIARAAVRATMLR